MGCVNGLEKGSLVLAKCNGRSSRQFLDGGLVSFSIIVTIMGEYDFQRVVCSGLWFIYAYILCFQLWGAIKVLMMISLQ